MIDLDQFDRMLLQELQENSKLTIKELAGRIGLSPTPVHERIKKLERMDIIIRYAAVVNPKEVGLQLTAFCNVSLKQHSQDYLLRFQEEVLRFKEVVECYHTAGSFDYLLKIMVPDMAAYQHFIVNELAAFAYIGKVESSFVMTEVKSFGGLPI